jgi:hypothetical protein
MQELGDERGRRRRLLGHESRANGRNCRQITGVDIECVGPVHMSSLTTTSPPAA